MAIKFSKFEVIVQCKACGREFKLDPVMHLSVMEWFDMHEVELECPHCKNEETVHI